MEEFLKYFGSYIRSFRKSLHMNQTEFSRKVEITPRQLSQIENGKSDCRLGTLGKLMTAVGKENLRAAILQYPAVYQKNFLLLFDRLAALDASGHEQETIEAILTLLNVPNGK